ncbi:MAG: hydrogenase maturation protease [Candidatus Eisenbacteria bacterium]
MKLEIETLARIEGHSGILVEMDGKKVKNVQVTVPEGPRLVEALTVGKTPAEDISITCRICAICTLSHRYAAIRGLERALGVKVPLKTQLTRTLMHMGEMIESHSLHVFLLSLPDLVNRSSAIDLLGDFKNEVVMALSIKKLGNRIMAVTSGRMIHGENPVLGGFGKFPSREELLEIKRAAESFIPDAIRTLDLLATFSLPAYFESDTVFIACKPEDGKFGFVSDVIGTSTGEERSVEEYKYFTNERVVPHSMSKRSSYKGKPFSVGSLARVNLLGDKLQGEAGKCFRKHYGPRWKTNPLFNIAAQALELLYALEEVPRLAEKIAELEDPAIVVPAKTEGEGTGAVEAPRGTLYHHYRIKNGLVAETDIITPTAQNLDDIERYIRLAAENFPDGPNQDLGLTLETIARAYDPCISCSTHLVEIRQAGSDAGTADGRRSPGATVDISFGGVRSQDVQLGGAGARSARADWRADLLRLMQGPTRPIFVGVGNIDRSDDGTGVVVAQRLKATGHGSVLLEENWHELADLCDGTTPVVFIDAADFGAAPGEIALFSADQARAGTLTTHRAPIDFARPLSECEGRDHYVLAIQPESTGFSRALSPRVAASVEKILVTLGSRT